MREAARDYKTKAKFAAVAGAVTLAALMAQPAAAGPGFAYSWLTNDQSFEKCLHAARGIAENRNYPRIRQTRFGVTGENPAETLYINCEDRNHVSLVLMRAGQPKYQEIDAIIAEMNERLHAD